MKRKIKKDIEVPNKLIVLLALVFLSLTLWSNWMLLDHTRIEKVSGKAVIGTVSICILYTDVLNVVLVKPTDDDVINGTIWLEAQIMNDSSYYIQSVIFSRTLNKIIGNATNVTAYPTNFSYKRLYNTTEAMDRNCFYAYDVAVNANSSCNPAGADGNEEITINNYDEEPNWDEFKNPLSTNFTALINSSVLHDFINVAGVTLAVIGAGAVHLDYDINVDDMDFDSNFEISNNYISFSWIGDSMRCLWRYNGSPMNITFYNLSLGNPVVNKDGAPCGNECNITFYNTTEISFYATLVGSDMYFTISELAKIDIWDTTDLNVSNSTRYANDDVKFYANYTNNATGQFLNDSSKYCKIRFKISGAYTAYDDMSFNTTSSLYEYTRSFASRGDYLWNVYCNDSSKMYNAAEEYDYVNISNRPPYLVREIPDQIWPQDTSLRGLDLNDYFNDTDGDTLIFSENLNQSYTPNIDIFITDEGIITFTPQYQWWGSNYVVFNASDSIDHAISNIVVLIVQSLPQIQESLNPPGAGGGAAGGKACEPDWYCTKWSICSDEGKRYRKCIDLNNCGIRINKPNETEACSFMPSCYNGIQDQNEDGIDCGGPCPPCTGCYDKIRNQGETGIDCGGPCPPCRCNDSIQNQGETGIDCGGGCPPCPTCSDGIKNCQKFINGSVICEENIDCGGPCRPCEKLPEIRAPSVVEQHRNMIIVTFSLSIALIFALLLFKITHPYLSRYFTKLKWRLSTMKKRRKIEIPKAYNARLEMLNKLKAIEKRLDKEKISLLTNEFFQATRRFFKDLFKLDYEFSYEELMKELTKEKMDHSLKMILISFFKKISDIRFGGHEVSKTELKSLIDEARLIVNMTTQKTEEEKIEERKVEQEKVTLYKAEGLDKIFGLISRAQNALTAHNKEKAKQCYFKIIHEYNVLPLSKKEKVYESVRRLYEEIKLMERE